MVCQSPIIYAQEPQESGFDIHYKEVAELHFYPHYCKQNFTDEKVAWDFAVQFAKDKRGSIVDVYVVNSRDKKPVKDYECKKISNLEFVL